MEGSFLDCGPTATIVHVFDFPYELDEKKVEDFFSQFGMVKAVHNQKYLGKPNIYTGTRLVNIVLNSTLPCTGGGHMCHVWYKGQPVVSNLCNDLGHKSATCPDKDKCRLCKQPGHFACNCPNPWGTTPEALLTGSGVTEIDGAVASVSAVDVMEGGGVDLVVTVEVGVADPSVSVSERV